MEMETIGKRICNLRKLFRLTQCQLAEQVHLSDKVISKWENDESKPNLDDITVLSKFFGVTFDYLITGNTAKQDEKVLSKQPTKEELIADAKADFIKRCNAIIRNNNLYKYKDKIFPEKRCNYFLTRYIPKEFADIGIFHPLVEKETEPYEIGINLKALLAFDDYDLFEKIIALDIPFCEKNDILRAHLITAEDIHGLTNVKFYGFLAHQDILIKQILKRYYDSEKNPKYTLQDYFDMNIKYYQEKYTDYLNEALKKLKKNNPNYWTIVKVLIEEGACVRKMVGVHYSQGRDYVLIMDYADDIFVTDLLYELACTKCSK